MKRQVSEILAERVESRLQEIGESKEWLGIQSGTSGAAVRKALSESRAVRADTLAAWAGVLGVSSDWLLGMSDEHPKETERKLRLACVAAALKIDVKHLPVVRDYLEKMASEDVDSSAKRKKHGSS